MSAFEQYLRLLLDLHRLMVEGGKEAEEDLIRDQMDAPYYKMSKEEMELANKVSEALYADGM